MGVLGSAYRVVTSPLQTIGIYSLNRSLGVGIRVSARSALQGTVIDNPTALLQQPNSPTRMERFLDITQSPLVDRVILGGQLLRLSFSDTKTTIVHQFQTGQAYIKTLLAEDKTSRK